LGCSIIKCTSKGLSVADAIKDISFKDMAKLGTYLPSIISIWKESIPPSSSSRTSFSKFP
jgi:hypothetical protein